MKNSLFAILALSACTTPSSTEWDAPSKRGPVLIGIVQHVDGTVLSNVLVTPHGGIATRFPGTPTRTDRQGRYRFDPIQGAFIGNGGGVMTDVYVGICIGESESGGNPGETQPWKDVRILNQPGVVKRLDFMVDLGAPGMDR